MKTIKIIATTLTPLLILFVAFALMGCEDDPGTSVGDAGGVETLEEGATLASPVSVTPESFNVTFVGQQVEFEAKGGHWPYTWSLAQPGSGTIQVMQNVPEDIKFTAVYTALAVTENQVIVRDGHNRTGTGAITANIAELDVLPDSSDFGTNVVAGASVAIQAQGGVPPYSWSTDSPLWLNLSSTTGNLITVSFSQSITNTFMMNVYVFDQAGASGSCVITGK